MSTNDDRRTPRRLFRQFRTRETDFELHETNRPIPRTVIAIALALAAWGIFTMLTNSQAALEEQAEAQQSELSEQEVFLAQGKAIFEANCVTCHQANGLGIRDAVPPLMGSRYVTETAAAPVQILLHGISGPISVQGQRYDGRMPRFGDVLSDSEIGAVVSFIRAEWGNTANPVTADFVASQRQLHPTDRGPWGGGQELERVTGVSADLGLVDDTDERGTK